MWHNSGHHNIAFHTHESPWRCHSVRILNIKLNTTTHAGIPNSCNISGMPQRRSNWTGARGNCGEVLTIVWRWWRWSLGCGDDDYVAMMTMVVMVRWRRLCGDGDDDRCGVVMTIIWRWWRWLWWCGDGDCVAMWWLRFCGDSDDDCWSVTGD